jgi:Host cell surface-exposed lipoprotein
MNPLWTRTAVVTVAVVAMFTIGGTATATAGTPVSRANAVRVAHEYLQTQGFSLKGLIGQLKYEGFSTSDARYGASHSGANWSRQAAKVAREYLRDQGFSRSGLVGQLQYEGFTRSQALYGVRAAGL